VDGFAWVSLGFGGLGFPVPLVKLGAAVLAWVDDVVVSAVALFDEVNPSAVADDVVAVAAGAAAVGVECGVECLFHGAPVSRASGLELDPLRGSIPAAWCGVL
jgi:hypothetical protein